MLVTFRSKAYSDITMFGDVALQLLSMMGHSGTVPGALMPEDIPGALQQLKEALSRLETTASPEQENEGETPVSLTHRAMPLVELLEAALRQEKPVMWDK